MEEGSKTAYKKNKCSLLLLPPRVIIGVLVGLRTGPLGPPPQGLCSVWWAPAEIRNVFF